MVAEIFLWFCYSDILSVDLLAIANFLNDCYYFSFFLSYICFIALNSKVAYNKNKEWIKSESRMKEGKCFT